MASRARVLLLPLLAALLAWGVPAARAHPLAPSLLEIVEQEPGRAEVRWKTPVARAPGAAMRPLLPPACPRTRELGAETEGTGLVQRWEVACSAPLEGASIEVAGIASSRADVILRVAMRDGRVLAAVLTPDRPAFTVPSREQPLQVAWSYLSLGFEHILTGADHLLFVLGLMLLIGTPRQLAWTVTAFTLGHSITLSLAALGLIRVPSAPVEALIALSVLVLALELARGRDARPTLLRRHPGLMAASFGLLHGLGFAGALREIGLPDGEIPLALLSFNLGIEAGQLVFCAALLGGWAVVRAVRPAPAAWGRGLATYAIGSLAAFWLIERTMASL
ncbi:MAG TPA: HupE/UreJ family protein [Geminicoccaceae bacterium]|nr:HupE/UreJ family protein [Geminicoccaceae bacterium]